MQAFFATPRELTRAEVRALIQRFGNAAKLVKKAGFRACRSMVRMAIW